MTIESVTVVSLGLFHVTKTIPYPTVERTEGGFWINDAFYSDYRIISVNYEK